MPSLKDNKTCTILEQYLSYLTVVKGRSPLTAIEYRIDNLLFFSFVKSKRNYAEEVIKLRDFSDVDIDFIKSITVADMYDFITYCGNERNVTIATRARKIVSIRQFWKYLRNKAHLLEINVAEELESPKLPKRMPKYLSLEEAIRLLIESENSARGFCILTVFLNSALRLSELVSINVEQVETDTLRIIGKGDKMRQVFLTPSTKNAISSWLEVRQTMNPQTNALFITKNGTRVTSRGVQDIVKKYLKKAGLDGRGLSTHKLRHTAATILLQYGKVDVRVLMEILGHSNLNTTQIYTHCSTEQLQSAVNSNPLASMFGK